MEKDIVPEAPVEKNIMPEAPTEKEIFNNAGPEELIRNKAPVEEHIITEALTEAPTVNVIVDTVEPKEATKPKALAEEHTMPKALIRTKEAKEAGQTREAEVKMINTAEMEEIWDPSSMALPRINKSPSSPPVRAGSPKPAKDQDSEEPIHMSSSLLPATLRARRRRHPCRRGSCMSIQVPTRKRGGRNLTKPKTQEVARPKAEAGTSARTTRANLEACDGRHGATGNPAQAHKTSEDRREEPGSHRPPPLPTIGAKFCQAVEGGAEP